MVTSLGNLYQNVLKLSVCLLALLKCLPCKDLCTTMQFNSQAEAQMQCPQFCAATQMSWNGQYKCNKHFWQGRTCPNGGCLCGCENRPLGAGLPGFGAGGLPGGNGLGGVGGASGMQPYVTAPQIITLPTVDDGDVDILPLMLPMMMGMGQRYPRYRDDDDLLLPLLLLLGSGNNGRRYRRRPAYDDPTRTSEQFKPEADATNSTEKTVTSVTTAITRKAKLASEQIRLASSNTNGSMPKTASARGDKTPLARIGLLLGEGTETTQINSQSPVGPELVRSSSASALSLESVVNQVKKGCTKLLKDLDANTSDLVIQQQPEIQPKPLYFADTNMLQ